MILRYRLSLAGLKGFARVYELKSSMTLYDFHKLMRDELDFAHDQLLLFKGMDADGNLVARYGLFDLGSGAVDEISLGKTWSEGIVSFTYFYDVTNKKSLIITCEGEVPAEPGKNYPELVETKGPNPVEFENGYVAYEDLPEDQKHHPGEPGWAKGEGDFDDLDDDDDEDIEDEDDDKEEEEEIYDEEEGGL